MKVILSCMNTSSFSLTLSWYICICSFLMDVSTIFFPLVPRYLSGRLWAENLFWNCQCNLFSVWVCVWGTFALKSLQMGCFLSPRHWVSLMFLTAEVLWFTSLAYGWMFLSDISLRWGNDLCLIVQPVLCLKLVSKFLFLKLVCSRFVGIVECEDVRVGIFRNEKIIGPLRTVNFCGIS